MRICCVVAFIMYYVCVRFFDFYLTPAVFPSARAAHSKKVAAAATKTLATHSHVSCVQCGWQLCTCKCNCDQQLKSERKAMLADNNILVCVFVVVALQSLSFIVGNTVADSHIINSC